MPEIGAVPASPTDIRDSPHFQSVPAALLDFIEAMSTLETIDTWLKEGPAAIAIKWLELGLDVRFDLQFREQVTTATRENRLGDLSRTNSDEWDRAANMD
ncbi:hypothetical protein [Arthrobacter glacialis]|uniref:hypothetical protein n=1 Tax=Arthrobacter glacialis TaxID=1664 RepID=UPI001A9DBF2F|nr:hypothetical protein [Arthrobacter glacialis]